MTTIGQTIKTLRRERGITQEQLAEYLGLTPSAISQWETDRVLPDVSQIPVLSNVFGVSADVLLGIDVDHREEAIDAIAEASRKLYYAGKYGECADYLRGQLAVYPTSHKLMAELADALLLSGGGTDEIVKLCRHVLAASTDTDVRDRAVSTLCYAYRNDRNVGEIRDLSPQMSRAYCSREELLMNCAGLFPEDEKKKIIHDNMNFCLIRVVDGMIRFAGMKHDGGEDYIFTDSERMELLRSAIAVMNSVYVDGDYFFDAQFVEQAYFDLAEIQLARGEYDGALDSLEAAASCAVQFDTYDNDAPHTSPAFRGCVDGGWIMDENGNRSRQLLDDLDGAVFDAIRGDDRFARIKTKLASYAKMPE